MTVEFGLGRFGDRRLEKGGPPCMRPLLSGQDLVFAAWAAGGRGKCSSRASCATIL
jgi:hypothetical protein